MSARIDGKLGREEIVDFATEMSGWEEQSFDIGMSKLIHPLTKSIATMIVRKHLDDDFWINIKVDGTNIVNCSLTTLSTI